MEGLIEPFVRALSREIAIVGACKSSQPVGTIYFGGGTPSLLTPKQFRQILETIDQYFDILDDVEVSLEANPNDLNVNYLADLRQVGANRLSIGMQSAVPQELKLFHRRHDHAMTVQAVSAARSAGFDNLNLDLIYGIPNQTLADWRVTVHEALALKPDHLSLYALGLEEGTPLQAWVASGYLLAPDDDLAADMYDLATDMLGAAGYEQYEISNWSIPGFACRHNLQYWHNLPYVGLGPGAHGFAGGVRYSTVLLPQQYIQAVEETNEHYEFPYTPATANAVVVDWQTEVSETLIMGLRLTQEGIQRHEFSRRFGIDLHDLYRSTLDKFTAYGLLQIDSDAVRLTSKGRLLSNMIFREFV